MVLNISKVCVCVHVRVCARACVCIYDQMERGHIQITIKGSEHDPEIQIWLV